MRHIVYCPRSCLAARQPDDVISVLAGPLMRRLAGLICIVHPTGCTTGCVHTAVVQLVVKCKHCINVVTTCSCSRLLRTG